MVGVMRTHDHEIVVDGITKRLNLLRDSSGKTQYQVSEDMPSYNTNMAPRGHLEIDQNNWIGGHGQPNFIDPKSYFDGQSIDTTNEGRVILGPLINSIFSAPVLQEYYNAGDNASNTFGGDSYAQTFTPATSHTIGSVKVKLSRPAGNPGNITFGIYATTTNNPITGVPVGAALCSGVINGNLLPFAGTWTQGISLGLGTYLTSGTMYALVSSVQNAVNSIHWSYDNSAPTYTGGRFCSLSGTTWSVGADYDFMFEEYAIAATEFDTAPVKFLWGATLNKLFCATSGKIYSYGGSGWIDEENLTGITDMIEFNGILYAALGNSTKYKYSSDGSTWTATDLTDGYANNFLSAPNPAGTANVLWKSKTPNEISSTTDGRTTGAGGVQWSSPAYIGDTSNNITNMFVANDKLMIGRTDNLYNYDTVGGVHALMDDLKQSRLTANFQYVTNWQGATYFSQGTGVTELTSGDSLSRVGPLQNTADMDKIGTVVGMAADVNYLYVAILEGTVTHIYKGKLISGNWSWCPFVYLGTNTCSTITIAQHSSTDKRLWFGYGTHTGYVYLADNPTTDANARFAPTGFIRLSYIYGSDPYWDKLLTSLLTETKGCAAGKAIQPKYRKDTETSMTNLTTSIVTNGVISTNLTTPLTSKKIQIELDFSTNDSTQTPEVFLVSLKGTEKPETFRVHECVYALGDSPAVRSKTTRDFLRTARASTALIKFADLRFGGSTVGVSGTDYVNVICQPGYPQEVEVSQEKGNQPYLGLKVRWQEVNYV